MHASRTEAISKAGEIEVQWAAVSQSSTITVWEHAVPPTAATARVRALEWLSVAPALHAHVTSEEVEVMQKRQHTAESAKLSFARICII